MHAAAHIVLQTSCCGIIPGIIVSPLRPTFTWGADAVRIFDPYHKNYTTVRNMSSWRWYPTVMTFPDGNMLIIGGNQAVRMILYQLSLFG